jgi:hypothetical protein
MAKVFLSFHSSAEADFSQEAVDKLNSNNIPYEVSDNKIYLINKEVRDYGLSIETGKNHYEPNEIFCMGIAESTVSTISMDRGRIDKSLFPVLYEIFDNTDFEMTLDCNSLSQTIRASIFYDEEKDEYYFESNFIEDYDEDYDEEW